MKELQLKYGCNPNQKFAKIYNEADDNLPIEILNGQPGYINLLDALNGWQLVKELEEATGLPAAASFKHVSPAGAAVGTPLSKELAKAYFVEGMNLSPLACAYARARGADRVASYGDFVALSATVDVPTAKILAGEVSDGVIAPDYEPEALEILKTKRQGKYLIIKIDKDYIPPVLEKRTLYGVTFEQNRNDCKIDAAILDNIVSESKDLPEYAVRDLIIALITLKYTQSNSVCYAVDGQAIGIGAGQQARIYCTRLAGNKADNWFLRQHPSILGLEFFENIKKFDRSNIIDQILQDDAEDFIEDESNWKDVLLKKPQILTREDKIKWLRQFNDVSVASDAFFPFGDNVERARKSGVKYIASPGGSVRDDNVIEVCNKYGITLAFIPLRLFHH